jgi:hypothetical protein
MANLNNENDYRNRQSTREADKAGHESGYREEDESSMDLDLGDDSSNNDDPIDTVEER